jgi:hypothetical protein
MTFYLEILIDACAELCHLTWKILTNTRVLVIFAKLRKATISFIMCLSVRPSVRLEQFCSRFTDFHEILYVSIFQNPVEKIQV